MSLILLIFCKIARWVWCSIILIWCDLGIEVGVVERVFFSYQIKLIERDSLEEWQRLEENGLGE